jgi:protein TonB
MTIIERMAKKFKKPLSRSIFIHLILLAMISIAIYWDSSVQKVDSTIVLENIQVTDRIKKVFHHAIHTIGIPHQEPVESDQKSTLDHPAESLENSTADEGGESGGIAPSEMQKYFIEVVSRLNRIKKYPKDAQFNEQEGVVQVLLEIAPDGKLIRSEIEKSTAFKSLNDAALNAIQSLGQLPALPLKPSGLAPSRPILLHIPIHFKLK